MIWTVLIGNTRAVAGLMRGKKLLRKVVVPTRSLRSQKKTLAWARRLRRISAAEGLIVASVVPPVDRTVRFSLRKVFGRSPLYVTSASAGIRVSVRKPSQVGADRLANAVAARELFGAPVIVVDYGTGTTFDVVDKKGGYCGGAILPGLGISLRALHDFTAKIPLVKFERTRSVIGRTTEEAVRSGVYHGAVGTTREILSGIRREMRSRPLAVATGGWCRVFEKSRLFDHIEPDLTLTGLALIWKKRHG